MKKKQLITVLITMLLMGIGLGSDLAKKIAKETYCTVQPSDCLQKDN